MKGPSFALIAVLAAACASPGPAVTPQTSASPSVDVSGPTVSIPVASTLARTTTPALTAQPPPTQQQTGSPPRGPGYDQLENLDPTAVTIVPVPAGTRVGGTAFCGHIAVFNDLDATMVNLLDFRTKAVTTVAGPEHGVQFDQPSVSPNWIAWVSWRQKIDRNSELLTEPIHWVISAVPASDPTSTPVRVADGTNSEPPAPDRPILAIDGDLLAYTVESPRQGHPQAHAVIVHDLASGIDIERVQTEQAVWDLDLSGANLVYSEGRVDDYGFEVATRVMLVGGDGNAARVAPNGYEVAIDGDRLVWAQTLTSESSGLVVDQAIMTASVSDLEPLQLSRQSTDDQAYSGYWSAAGDGLISWDDRSLGKVDDHIEVWDPVTGMTIPIFKPDTYTLSGICGGSIGWQGAVEAPPGSLFEAFYSAPLEAVQRLFE